MTKVVKGFVLYITLLGTLKGCDKLFVEGVKSYTQKKTGEPILLKHFGYEHIVYSNRTQKETFLNFVFTLANTYHRNWSNID